MKIARIIYEGKVCFAKVEDDKYFLIEGDCFQQKKIETLPLSGEIKLLAPIIPTKILALGANYKKHAEELKLKINPSPIIFMKPDTSIIASFENIILPCDATRVDYEAELAIIIKKDCKNVKEENAKDYILGYTCANDVSERVFQKADGQWTRAKGFDTFCPLGPWIVTDIDAGNLELKTILNGEVVQKGNTKDMINGIEKIIAFISHIMTLKKGDIILTGTPEGIGQIKNGDKVEIEIEKIGRICNNVVQG